MDAQVVDNPDQNRFELAVDGSVAVAQYRVADGRMILTHTEVPHELSGRGIGSRLAQGVFESLCAKGMRVVAECPFMAAYVSRHPQFADLLDG